MKAVLLAGGEGTRLRPISAECPKPLVRLFDKPVMEYGIELLKQHDFDDITVTLGVMPQKIKDYFGSGGAFGVRLSYSIEEIPMGTAGGVSAALPNPVEEPVLILSGDAITDFDLTAALTFHKDKKADATLLLSRQKKLLDYGLVMLDNNKEVIRFIEKPTWNQVFSNTVNTGIYILSPAALALIPKDRPYDFARDLFPAMLEQGMRIMGYCAEGYWCDMGDSDAYLNCCCDILDGQVKLNLPRQSEVPQDVLLTPPCYLAENITFGKNVRIGPYAVIGAGSVLHDGAVVEAGVVDGAIMEAQARCEGAYVGRGTVMGQGSVAREGSVVGENVTIGSGAELLETARIWPRKEIAPGSRISGSVSRGANKKAVLFDGEGKIRGLPHVDISPEFCARLGAAAAQTAPGETALAWSGGEAARICALAIEVGLTSAGNRALITDARYPACTGFCGGLYHIPLSVFVEQNEREVIITFYEKDGLPLRRVMEKKLEALTLRGEVPFCDPDKMISSKTLNGLSGLYAYTASLPPSWLVKSLPRALFSAAGQGEAAENLRRALTVCQSIGGGIIFHISKDGFTLTAEPEAGRKINMARLTGLMVLSEILCGAKEIALPASAPALPEEFAKSRGVTVLRDGRDGEAARMLLASQPYFYDPLCMASRFSYACRTLETTLGGLDRQLPSYYLRSGEIPIQGDRGAVMRALLDDASDAELYDGFSVQTASGWVRVAPLAEKSALRIIAEGSSMEAAHEIYADYTQKARRADTSESFNR